MPGYSHAGSRRRCQPVQHRLRRGAFRGVQIDFVDSQLSPAGRSCGGRNHPIARHLLGLGHQWTVKLVVRGPPRHRVHQVGSDGQGIRQGSGGENLPVPSRSRRLRSHSQVQPAGFGPRRGPQGGEDNVGPPAIGRCAIHRFAQVDSVPGLIAQLDVNRPKAFNPGSRMPSGRPQPAARCAGRSGQVLGQRARLGLAHGRGNHNPGLGAHFLAQLQKLRNPHRNVLHGVRPAQKSGPLPGCRRSQQVVDATAQPGVALHHPQYARVQLFQSLHHLVAEDRVVGWVAARQFQVHIVH